MTSHKALPYNNLKMMCLFNMTREQMAFQILRLMISNDWKFDVSEKDWDSQAVERAYRIADLFIREGNITNVET